MDPNGEEIKEQSKTEVIFEESGKYLDSRSLNNRKARMPKLTKPEWVHLAYLLMCEGTDKIASFPYLTAVFCHLQPAALNRLSTCLLGITSIKIFSGLHLDVFKLGAYNYYHYLAIKELHQAGTVKDGRVVNSYPERDIVEQEEQRRFYTEHFLASEQAIDAARESIRRNCYARKIAPHLGAQLSTIEKLAVLHKLLEAIKAKRESIKSRSDFTATE